VFVDGGVGMAVAPVEPVVPECGDAVERLALRLAGGGAASDAAFGDEDGTRKERAGGIV